MMALGLASINNKDATTAAINANTARSRACKGGIQFESKKNTAEEDDKN